MDGVKFKLSGNEIARLINAQATQSRELLVLEQQRLDAIVVLSNNKQDEEATKCRIAELKEEIDGLEFLAAHVDDKEEFQLTVDQLCGLGVKIPYSFGRD